jgi:Oxysterol-binding protein
MSTLHFHMSATKPFNPIIGETFQCKVKDTYCYLEQTSNHPPIYNYYFKNAKSISFGYVDMQTNMGTNSVQVISKGKNLTKFQDGVVYTATYPEYEIRGIMMGKRLVNFVGQLTVQDLVNKF